MGGWLFTGRQHCCESVDFAARSIDNCRANASFQSNTLVHDVDVGKIHSRHELAWQPLDVILSCHMSIYIQQMVHKCGGCTSCCYHRCVAARSIDNCRANASFQSNTLVHDVDVGKIHSRHELAWQPLDVILSCHMSIYIQQMVHKCGGCTSCWMYID